MVSILHRQSRDLGFHWTRPILLSFVLTLFKGRFNQFKPAKDAKIFASNGDFPKPLLHYKVTELSIIFCHLIQIERPEMHCNVMENNSLHFEWTKPADFINPLVYLFSKYSRNLSYIT